MFAEVLAALSKGFLVTLELFGITLVGAIPCGLLICLGSMSKIKPLKAVLRFIIWVIRGTPLMLQLLIIYYGPGLILGSNWWGSGEHGRFIATIVAFIINYACYFSEIYRGGIESISKGQYEAGEVLGMTKAQIFFRIILAQVIKRIIPPMGNEIITLVKDTSLARVVSCVELLKAAQDIVGLKAIIWPIFYIGAFYLLFTGVLTIVFGRIEKKLDYYKG